MGNNRTGQFTQEDGHRLAVDMLGEMEKHWSERYYAVEKALDAMPADEADAKLTELSAQRWQSDKSDILRRYLANVAASGSAELEHGFLAVLSDILGSQFSGEDYTPDVIEAYEP